MLTSYQKRLLQKSIMKIEANTTAEIHIAFYRKIKNNILEDAEKFFLKTELTEGKDKNNILIYIVEPARQFAILGDAGIHAKVGDQFWESISKCLSESFKKNKMYEGLEECLRELDSTLSRAFPK